MISLLIVVMLIATLFYLSRGSKVNNDHEKQSLTITTKSAELELDIEIADTVEERAKGLMYRTELGEDSGMLFVFNQESENAFWMKNTLIPLDIIFINSEGVIVDIQKNAQPCKSDPCQLYPPLAKYLYAIEVNGGWCDKKGVKSGDIVTLPQ